MITDQKPGGTGWANSIGPLNVMVYFFAPVSGSSLPSSGPGIDRLDGRVRGQPEDLDDAS